MAHKQYRYVSDILPLKTVVFRKRQTFSTNMNSKLQKQIITAYEVIGRISKNAYICKDVISGKEGIFPIDQLVSTPLNLEEIRQILEEMKKLPG